jgi:uncharacterized membrane protein YgdD (TMEM256/DUF423 family)
MNDRLAIRVAGLFGFLGILLGAFGAHLFRGVLELFGTAEFWRTGVTYHLVHAVVLLVLAGWRPIPRLPFLLILGGSIIFSGSLYALALTNLRWLGAVTPLGGVGMLCGWLTIAWKSHASV